MEEVAGRKSKLVLNLAEKPSDPFPEASSPTLLKFKQLHSIIS